MEEYDLALLLVIALCVSRVPSWEHFDLLCSPCHDGWFHLEPKVMGRNDQGNLKLRLKRIFPASKSFLSGVCSSDEKSNK